MIFFQALKSGAEFKDKPVKYESKVGVNTIKIHREYQNAAGVCVSIFAALSFLIGSADIKAQDYDPLLTEQPIVFVVRPQYKEDHHNSATMYNAAT